MSKKGGRRGAKNSFNEQKASQPHQVQIFSNEKFFALDMAVNHRNKCYLTDLPVADVDPSVCIFPKSKASFKQMVLGVVGSDGQKCPIVFIGAGKRVNADV